MLYRHVIFAVFGLTGPAMALGLSAADCAQIQATYGVMPSQCDGTQNAAYPGRFITEPTDDMRQSNIFFVNSGADLDATAMLQLQRLAELLNAPSMQNVCLKLTGHSDATGGRLVNQEMGAKRAAAVKNRLALLMINPARIETVESMGEDSHLPGLREDSPWQRRVTIWARDCSMY